jgi:hypothetical protein
VYFRQPLAHALGLGFQVLQVLFNSRRLFLFGREPAMEAEPMPSATAALTLVVAATAVLGSAATAAAP